MAHPGKKTNDKNAAGGPVWRQGYVPQQAPVAQHQKISLFTRRRFSIHREKRLWLVLLVSGVMLLLIGAALMIPPAVARGKRQQAESALQTLYREAIPPETSGLPAAAIRTAALPEASPVSIAIVSPTPLSPALPPLRSFATRAPWQVYMTRGRFLPLRKINKDIAGWLTIDRFLDLPVVQRDNTYYLTHDYYGKTSPSGTLFLDENYDFTPPSENLLIHGHNMRDGSMFGSLYKYAERAFYTDHWFIRFESLYEESDYAVFAAFSVSGDSRDLSYFRYAYSHFDTDAQFNDFITALRKRSVVRSGLDVLPTDRLLMLSTCINESDYFVVIARRVREDETRENVQLMSVLSPYQ